MRQVYLTLAAVVRDQEHYIREWLCFHHLIGVERMVIVLHKCNDKTGSEIRRLPFFDEKIKLHRVVNDEQRVQLGAFRWMIDAYGSSTEWMLFTDADEFFFGTEEDDLRNILSRYEKFGGLAAHWHMFGASGFVKKPPMPSIKHFVERIPDDQFVLRGIKCAVKPKGIRDLLSPHMFLTRQPVVRENFDIVPPTGIWQYEGTPQWNVVRCNHYCTRSMEDWVDRRKRGSCNDLRCADNYGIPHFFKYQNHAQMVSDFTIRRFIPKLEELLF